MPSAKPTAAKNSNSHSGQRPATFARLSPRKRLLFGLLALLFPLLLVILAETALRLAGYGGYPPTMRRVGPVAGGELVITDQQGAVSYFFANKERPGYNDQYSFLNPKPTNTFRVFLVGESAMKGYPQPRNLAASAFLQAMLQDAWPDRRVEVINLGTTAVASYPVLGMMTEALAYEPDLIIIHTGHNEFFGTYGVASIGQAGAKPWMLGATRFVHSLALVQAVGKLRHPKTDPGNRTLMEIMVGQASVAPGDWRRKAAANNLHHNLAAMIERCRKQNVPVLVCTLPSNEAGLAPVGRSQPAGTAQGGPDALEQFNLGKAAAAAGKSAEALQHFIQARDLDTMPWRATSPAQEAVRRAAGEYNATVCDLEQAFRDASPGGVIGWELMDDHVHPTLRGQALMAETFVNALTNLTGKAQLSAAAHARIARWEEYGRRLGENPYDQYGVAHSMRVLFEVPFMRASNPEAYERLASFCAKFEREADPEILPVLREWQTFRPHAGAKRPLSGMVARVLMRQRKHAEALRYYEIACQAVPEYTSWHMEYVYFALVAKEKINGALTEADRARAQREIEQGLVLLRRGFSETGFAERYLGRLHQLRGEFAEAIPFLQASRRKLTGMDLVAADQALAVSYVRTRQTDKARELVNHGIKNAGEYANLYRQMLDELGTLEQTTGGRSATNAPVQGGSLPR
jgi:tetratricopeptide (TPR) repeat protein